MLSFSTPSSSETPVFPPFLADPLLTTHLVLPSSLAMTQISPNFFVHLMTKIAGPGDYMKIYTLIMEETKNNQKFKSLDHVLQSSFLSEENKEFIFTCFQKTQKTIHALYKWMSLYRHSKSSIKMDKDLGWNDLQSKDKDVMMLYHEKAKYLFSLRDLRNIIESALTHTQNFFTRPLECKNPFNNLPFTKSQLYNIYFRLLHSSYKISVVFHQYFLCHFDLELFEMENEYLIRDYAIRQYIKNTSADVMYPKIIHMLYQYNRKIMIHKEFPKEKLVAIMKPYLYLYILHTTHIEGTEIRHSSHLLLKQMLKKFYLYNPQFGKEMFVRTLATETSYTVSYNTLHFPFTMMDIQKIKYKSQNINQLQLPTRSPVFRRGTVRESTNEEEEEDVFFPPIRRARTRRSRVRAPGASPLLVERRDLSEIVLEDSPPPLVDILSTPILQDTSPLPPLVFMQDPSLGGGPETLHIRGFENPLLGGEPLRFLQYVNSVDRIPSRGFYEVEDEEETTTTEDDDSDIPGLVDPSDDEGETTDDEEASVME